MQLRSSAVVNGFLKTGQTLSPQSGSRVTGVIEQYATLTPLNALPWSVTLPDLGPNVGLEPGTSRSLAPGSYGGISVKTSATLRLRAGTYYVNSLSAEPSSTLELTTSSGPIIVYARSGFTFRGKYRFLGDDASVLWVNIGAGEVKVESPFIGSIAAPNGSIRLAPVGTPSFRGSFFGKSILVEARTSVTLAPFKRWDLIFPVRPFVDCVNHFDSTHFSASLGYENIMDIPVTIPLGTNNSLEPSSTDSPPITKFEPGLHHDVFLAPFGASLTWHLAEKAAIATASGPDCTLTQYTSASSREVVTGVGEAAGELAPTVAARLLPDTHGPGYSVGALPAGNGLTPASPNANAAPSEELAVVQQALAAQAATPAPFSVSIIWMAIGSDAACWGGDPYVRVFVNGQNIAGEMPLPTDCGGVSTCAGAYGYSDGIATTDIVKPSDSTATVRLQLTDRDSTLCGGDDDLEVDTGDFVVNNFVGQPEFLQHCQENDGWKICWIINGNGQRRACMNWNAQYADGADPVQGFGATEDYLASAGLQKVPASNAIAEVNFKNGAYNATYSGPLDVDGCVPIDETPANSHWAFDPNAGVNGMTISYKWSSEFCVDPNDNGCLDASGQRTAGARVLVKAVGSTADPFRLCSVLTQDESYVDSTGACQVTHASQGAFAELQSDNPTGRLLAIVDRHTAETRVAAMMSNLLKREVETGGGVGLVSALVSRRLAGDGKNLARLSPATVAETPLGEPDTFYDGLVTDSVIIRPNLCCDQSGFTNCSAAPDTNSCASNQRFLFGSDYWKYMVLHEVGHLIQDRMTGSLTPDYERNGVVGAPAKCRCDHVTASNRIHCLQGLQPGMASQIEGFAHFYATRAFNRDDRTSDGVFRYYKDFLDDQCLPGVATADCRAFQGLVSSPPPLPVNPRKSEKWRNQFCTVDAVAPSALTSMGTELDWMRFYLAWNTVGTNKSSLDEIADVYIQACGGIPCNGSTKVTFEGTFKPDGSVETASLNAAAQAALLRNDPTGTKYQRFLGLGDEFGVSANTSR